MFKIITIMFHQTEMLNWYYTMLLSIILCRKISEVIIHDQLLLCNVCDMVPSLSGLCAAYIFILVFKPISTPPDDGRGKFNCFSAHERNEEFHFKSRNTMGFPVCFPQAVAFWGQEAYVSFPGIKS